MNKDITWEVIKLSTTVYALQGKHINLPAKLVYIGGPEEVGGIYLLMTHNISQYKRKRSFFRNYT